MTLLLSRRGADYAVCNHPALPMYRWMRRTSSTWTYIKEPKTYVQTSAEDEMVLVFDRWLWFVRDDKVTRHFNEGYVVIARGPKKDLWDTFIAHGRMLVSS